MAKNRMICEANQIDYMTIRKAMCGGARTVEELKEMTGVCNDCSGCKGELEKILHTVCGCKGVSLETVVAAIQNGADTVEKIGEATGAATGNDCEKCKVLIANIIELGR